MGIQASGIKLDIWAAGCILGEVVHGEPLFPGNSETETLKIQFELLDIPPSAEAQAFYPDLLRLKDHLLKACSQGGRRRLPAIEPQACALMRHMLQFVPGA